MTTLCEMIMECRAIKGMDRLVLYGWASHLEEGNDTLYCSKETVADAIGVSADTVLRRTQALVEAGWLIDTGEQKQCKFGWTPVRIVNVPVIVGLVEAQCRKLPPVANCTPSQIAAQGSRCSGLSGFRSSGLSGSPSFFPSCGSATPTTTGVPPVVVTALLRTEDKPENLEPTPTAAPTVMANSEAPPHGRVCPRCKELWSRAKNHVCKPEVKSSLAEMLAKEFDEDYGQEPMVNKAEEARQRVEAVGQKSGGSIVEEGRTTATATPFAQSPRSAAPHGLNGALLAEGWSHAETSGAMPMSLFRNPWMKSGLRVLIHRRYLWNSFAPNACPPVALQWLARAPQGIAPTTTRSEPRWVRGRER